MRHCEVIRRIRVLPVDLGVHHVKRAIQTGLQGKFRHLRAVDLGAWRLTRMTISYFPSPASTSTDWFQGDNLKYAQSMPGLAIENALEEIR